MRLTQSAIIHHLGANRVYFVSVAISLFAFTLVVANYAYGESNLHFFKLDNKVGRIICTAMYLAMVFRAQVRV
jgi:AGCS family alanine or glycine:cation symporter